MPLVKLEIQDNDSCWGLWEITESRKELEILLNNEEDLKKLGKIRSEDKVSEKIAARLILKEILKSWNQPYQGTSGEESGKPSLIDYPYYVSLSHSHKAAVAFIHKKREIGIDIELIQEKIERIAPRVFREVEMGKMSTNDEFLTILWTFKEVLYKIFGNRGLDFKENIEIPYVKKEEKKGYGKGIIRINNQVDDYNLKFERFKNFIISLNTYSF